AADDRDRVVPVRGRGLLAVPVVPRDDLGEPGGGELPADPGARRRTLRVPGAGEGARPAGPGAVGVGRGHHRPGADPVADGVRAVPGRPPAVLRAVLSPGERPRVASARGYTRPCTHAAPRSLGPLTRG